MNITAVVLTRGDYKRKWPGVEVLVHRSEIRNAAEQQQARFTAALAVKTDYWFWLDDDDDLPTDYGAVLCRCISAKQPLVYTDELVRSTSLGDFRTFPGKYSREAHLANPLKVHHLAVYRARESHEAIHKMPIGHYWPEMLLSWSVASVGVEYIPVVGYIWNKNDGIGMHSWPSTQCAIMRACIWCKAHP